MYWAFMIRRALAVRLYRDQALGVGLVGLFGEMEFIALAPLASYGYSTILKGAVTPVFQAWELTVAAFEIALFYWVDSSILAARRSDPLLRDTFGWRRLRPGLWVVLIALEIASLLLPFSAFRGFISPVGFLTVELPLMVPLFSGAVVLPAAARRSGDPTLRRHLGWFALFVIGAFLTGVPSFFFSTGKPLTPDILAQSLTWTYTIAVIACYPIYRSVRSLVPLSRLTMDP